MTTESSSWLESLLASLRPTAPYAEFCDNLVIEKLSSELGAGDEATEVWEDLTKALRLAVVRRGYAYEWNMFRRTLCITRLPSLVDCERMAELYDRSTPDELRRRIRELSGVQFEMFLRSLLSAESCLTNVFITRVSHDHGIDFKASLREGPLVPPLPLIGQAKQTGAPITAGMARDFVGALDTCGETKSVVGLYVSTSGFTAPAIEAFERTRYHVMTWDLDAVAKRAQDGGVGVQRRDLQFTVLDETFWDELGGRP